MNGAEHRLPDLDRPRVVAVTGATGLIGSALTPLLRQHGHQVRSVSRGSSGDIRWDPEAGRIDPVELEEVDAIVHLAGEPIAQRWTRAARKRILESRKNGTRALADAVAALTPPPKVFVSMSGINAYGASREEILTEESGPGRGFLAEVCREWEGATAPAAAAGARTAIIRAGIVLSPRGGALAKLLPVFRAGLGGPIGMGRRWMSWIALDDIAAVLAQAILDERYTGVINAVAPNPVRNGDFARELAKCLHRPARAIIPPAALRLSMGQMAEETALGSLRVEPAKLRELGYAFRFPHLAEALQHLLNET